MDHLPKAYQELSHAWNAIDGMTKSTTFEEYERNWMSFLSHIHKVWVKAEQEGKSVKKFQPWQGEYVKLTRGDSLLRYIWQARDADQHTIQELIKERPERTVYYPDAKDVDGRDHSPPFTLSGYGFTKDGERVDLEMGEPGVEIRYAKDIIVIPFVNRGVSYAVPDSHLGNPISNHDSLILAQLTYNFYYDYLEDAEKFLLENK